MDTVKEEIHAELAAVPVPLTRSFSENVDVLLREHHSVRLLALVILSILFPVAVGAVVMVARYVVPAVWGWFQISSNVSWHWLKIIPAFVAESSIIGGAIYLPGLTVVGIAKILNVYGDLATTEVDAKIDNLRGQQSEAEIHLEQSDTAHLIPLVRLTRPANLVRRNSHEATC
jgi:hypothetical protein